MPAEQELTDFDTVSLVVDRKAQARIIDEARKSDAKELARICAWTILVLAIFFGMFLAIFLPTIPKSGNSLDNANTEEEPCYCQCSSSESHTNPDLPIASATDERQHRVKRFPNGLTAMLTSDPETDVSSAAMAVFAGSQDDPKDFQGLAHFLEHMLFMGTTKYPSEDEYAKFLSRNGGSDNAYTSGDYTNFYFKVKNTALDEALDRFAQFFISPLLKASSIEREMHAVDSEHQKNLQQDGWRLWHLVQVLSRSGSRFDHFGTGDLTTLNKTNIREELVHFHQEHYVAPRMSLAVLGNVSLDELEEWVERSFAQIPTGDRRPDPPAEPTDELLPTPSRVFVKPVGEVNEMTIYWSVASEQKQTMHRASQYIGHMLGSEDSSSLHSYLKQKGWADGLEAGSYYEASSFAIFSVSITLTPAGLKATSEIAGAVFATLALLRDKAVDCKRWEEVQRLYALNFRFKDKPDPTDYTTDVAATLRYAEPRDVLGAANAFRWSAELTTTLLASLTPERAMLMVVSPSVKDKAVEWLTEPVYGTEYFKEAVTAKDINRWSSADGLGEYEAIALPSTNEFMPTELNQLTTDSPAETQPKLVLNNTGLRVWFMKDSTFNVPKLVAKCLFGNAGVHSTVQHWIASKMLVRILSDKLNAELYQASLAGLQGSFGLAQQGIVLTVSGFNDKAGLLFELLTNTLISAELEADRFDVLSEMLRQDLVNMRTEMPYRLLYSYLEPLIGVHPGYAMDTQLDALKALSLTDVGALRSELLAAVHVDCLVHGNADHDAAVELGDKINDAVRPALALSNLVLPKPVSLARREEVRLVSAPFSAAEKNGGVEQIYQLEQPAECWRASRAVGRFNAAAGTRISGSVSFEQSTSSQPTIIKVELAGLGQGQSSYHVHARAIHSDDTPCSAQSVGGHFDPTRQGTACTTNGDWSKCEVGDLSGRHGKLAGAGSATVTVEVSDEQITLSGANSIVGKSIVIHDATGARVACADIVAEGSRSSLWRSASKAESDTCVGSQIDLSMKLSLLAHIAKEPAFDTLRTKEQLGYVVFLFHSGHISFDAHVMTLNLLVQSTQPIDFLKTRMDSFLIGFEHHLLEMTDAEFSEAKAGYIALKKKRFDSLSEQSGFLWTEIAQRTLLFDRKQREIDVLKQLTLQDVLGLYRDVVLDVWQRRRISIELYGAGGKVVDDGSVPILRANNTAAIDSWKERRML